MKQFCLVSYYFHFLGPNNFLSTYFLDIFNLCSSHRTTDLRPTTESDNKCYQLMIGNYNFLHILALPLISLHLRNLLCNYCCFIHVELVFSQMNVSVEGHALAQAGDNSKCWKFHTCTHKQHYILMTSFTKCSNLQEQSIISVQKSNHSLTQYHQQKG